MTMNLKLSAVAVAALMGSASAMAAAPAKMETGDSALAFIAMDTVGTPSSLFVDLGFKFSEFVPTAALTQPGQSVVWNFNNNSVSVNGIAKPGTYNWSTQLAAFNGFFEAGDVVRFGVIGGQIGGFPDTFLSTGTPTASQFANLGDALTSNFGVADTLWANQAGKGTFTQAGFGANAVSGGTAAATGAVNANGNFGPNGNWQLNSTWNATVPVGTANNLYFLSNDQSQFPNARIDGAFTYNAGVLTWQAAQTAPVPEPSAFMMAAAGLAVLAFAGRRRREER